MLFPRVVLLAVVGDERDRRMKDGAGAEHLLVIGVERQPRLQGQHDEGDDVAEGAEEEKGEGVLFPVLGSGVQASLDPAQPVRRPVMAVQKPGQIDTDRDRQRHGRADDEQREKPNRTHTEESLPWELLPSETLSFWRAGSVSDRSPPGVLRSLTLPARHIVSASQAFAMPARPPPRIAERKPCRREQMRQREHRYGRRSGRDRPCRVRCGPGILQSSPRADFTPGSA